MSDPLVTTDAAIEGGKAVGSAGGLLAIGVMLFQKFARKVEVDDEREAKALESVAAELKTLNAGVSEIRTDVKLVMQAQSATAADVEKHDAKIEALQREMGELAGAFELLKEQVQR